MKLPFCASRAFLPNDLVIGHFHPHAATCSCGVGGDKVVLFPKNRLMRGYSYEINGYAIYI